MAAVNISVWDQVAKGNASGQSSWEITCNHCGHSFVGNATKIKKHLLATGDVKACSGCPEHVLTALRTASAAKAAAQDSKKRTRDLQEELDQSKKARVSAQVPLAAGRAAAAAARVGSSVPLLGRTQLQHKQLLPSSSMQRVYHSRRLKGTNGTGF